MTDHLHSVYVDGCYRCALGRDEVRANDGYCYDDDCTRGAHHEGNHHYPDWYVMDVAETEAARHAETLRILAE